jgi:hypothetical protein
MMLISVVVPGACWPVVSSYSADVSTTFGVTVTTPPTPAAKQPVDVCWNESVTLRVPCPSMEEDHTSSALAKSAVNTAEIEAPVPLGSETVIWYLNGIYALRFSFALY